MTPLQAILRGLVVAMLLTTVLPARAADRAVALTMGMASRLSLDRPFETVLVGHPGIVDIRSEDGRSVVLEPLHPGATNLIFIDGNSIAIDNVRISVSPDSGT